MKRLTEDKYEKQGDYHWQDYKKGEIFYRSHTHYLLKEFSKKEKGTILDVGCGDGLITCFLRWKGWDIEGIDVSKRGIEIANKKCPTVEFNIRDIFDEKKQYDYLLVSEVIEHLSNPKEFLEKVKTLFKKEMLITTFNKEFHDEPDPYHFTEYREKEFENLLKLYFDKVRVEADTVHLYAWVK